MTPSTYFSLTFPIFFCLQPRPQLSPFSPLSKNGLNLMPRSPIFFPFPSCITWFPLFFIRLFQKIIQYPFSFSFLQFQFSIISLRIFSTYNKPHLFVLFGSLPNFLYFSHFCLSISSFLTIYSYHLSVFLLLIPFKEILPLFYSFSTVFYFLSLSQGSFISKLIPTPFRHYLFHILCVTKAFFRFFSLPTPPFLSLNSSLVFHTPFFLISQFFLLLTVFRCLLLFSFC